MSVGYQLDGLSDALRRMRQMAVGVVTLRALMAELSARGVEQTNRRITEDKASPEGAIWPQWSPRYAGSVHSGQGLLEKSGALRDSIQARSGPAFAEWGAGVEYAAIHQFGGLPGMAPGAAAIPARPFLGLSGEDEAEMIGVIEGYVAGLANGLP